MKKLFLLSLLLLTGCSISNPSEGQKIGRIVKLADEGIIFKSCEDELIRGGLIDGSGSMGLSFSFTIESPRLKVLAKEAFENQYEVVLSYRCELISSWTRSENENPHFVT